MQGLRYPWPEITKNAAQVIVKLKREDMVDDLVDFLDEGDPCAPFEQEKKGEKVMVVRELVRLNHHHNCITCHAPATSDPDFNKNGWTKDFVAAHVTIPGQDFASLPTGFGYSAGGSRFPDLAVRVDVTYLRQDFSLMQKVENGMSGKAEERFDFLVRTRELTQSEAKAYESWRERQGRNYRSPNHQAAVAALRQLTNATAESTAAAWRAQISGMAGNVTQRVVPVQDNGTRLGPTSTFLAAKSTSDVRSLGVTPRLPAASTGRRVVKIDPLKNR